jgi:hypothetical protein
MFPSQRVQQLRAQLRVCPTMAIILQATSSIYIHPAPLSILLWLLLQCQNFRIMTPRYPLDRMTSYLLLANIGRRGVRRDSLVELVFGGGFARRRFFPEEVVPGGGCVLRRLSPGEVSVGRCFPLAVRFLLVSDFLSGRRARGVFFYTAFALSFPSSSLKLPPSQAFIGSPTHPHLKDHLRCLAADAGRTGAQLLGEEKSASFWQDQSASERTSHEQGRGQWPCLVFLQRGRQQSYLFGS